MCMWCISLPDKNSPDRKTEKKKIPSQTFRIRNSHTAYLQQLLNDEYHHLSQVHDEEYINILNFHSVTLMEFHNSHSHLYYAI